MNGAEYVFGAKTERERAAEKPVFEFGFAPEKKKNNVCAANFFMGGCNKNFA